MELRKLILLSVSVLTAFLVLGQTECPEPLVPPDMCRPTHVAPAYFGPNALPVFPMIDGVVDGRFRLSLASDNYLGYYQDITTGLWAELRIPLFSRRATLSVWMPVLEHYRLTDERIAHSSITDTVYSGTGVGDVYVATDILVLTENDMRPAVTGRIGIKTASGNDYSRARFFDSPAYWLEAAIGKEFAFGGSYPVTLRSALSGGFLCWQTDHNRQNDAVMYAASLKVSTRHFSISETYSGYHGWELDGDSPMELRTEVEVYIPLKGREGRIVHDALAVTARYGYGLRDYPYYSFRIGLVYRLPLIDSEPK